MFGWDLPWYGAIGLALVGITAVIVLAHIAEAWMRPRCPKCGSSVHVFWFEGEPMCNVHNINARRAPQVRKE